MKTEETPGSGLVREIFASVQGEGKYLGRTQFFVRLSGCNLACPYCDTRHSPARRMSADAVIEAVEDLRREHGAPHSVSLTGGEPMFQPRLCAEIMRQLHARGYATYLETNATLPDAEVIGLCDIISADIKAPEDAATTDDIWDRHKAFLRAAAGKDLFVKMPVSMKTLASSLARAAETVAEISPKIPFFLQPVHSLDPDVVSRSGEKLRYLAALAGQHLENVSVVPQVHKLFFVH